jgi:hypothetical protein
VLYCICFVARTFFIVYVSSRRWVTAQIRMVSGCTVCWTGEFGIRNYKWHTNSRTQVLIVKISNILCIYQDGLKKVYLYVEL